MRRRSVRVIVAALGAVAIGAFIAVGSLAAKRPAGCSASHLILAGKATHGYGFGTVGTQSIYIRQRIRNSGASCTFDLPKTIGAVNAKGLRRAVKVENAGRATSYRIPHEGRNTIVIGAWWRIPGLKKVPRSRCKDAITNVTRVAIPLSVGDLHIKLGVAWRKVCKSPASASITIRSQRRS